jgi:hypothetical protein
LHARLVLVPLPHLLVHEVFQAVLPVLLRFLSARKDNDGEKWELWEITDDEAKEVEKKPNKHRCERVLYP